MIVLDDLGFAQLGCFGSDIATPDHRPASPPAACATTASTSRRCARRRGPACSPGRNHHAVGMGFARRHAHRLPRLQRPHPAVGGRAAAAAARRRLQHVRRRQVAPGAALGAERVGAVRPLAARAGVRALLRLPRRRHQPVGARPRAPTTASSSRPAPPTRATTSPRTWPTGRSASSRTSSTPRPTSRSSSTSPPAPMHAPHQAPRRVDRAATGAGSTTAGRRWRERTFARQVEPRASSPRAPR